MMFLKMHSTHLSLNAQTLGNYFHSFLSQRQGFFSFYMSRMLSAIKSATCLDFKMPNHLQDGALEKELYQIWRQMSELASNMKVLSVSAKHLMLADRSRLARLAHVAMLVQ